MGWNESIQSLSADLAAEDAVRREQDKAQAAELVAIDLPTLENKELVKLFARCVAGSGSIPINDALVSIRDNVQAEVLGRMK